MMKENVKRVKSLLLFELPLNYSYVSSQFTIQHQKRLLKFPSWSLKATKRQIISRYWFNDVIIHFAFLFGLAAVSTTPFIGRIDFSFLPASMLAGSIAFFVLLVINYWPAYYLDFLPKLDSLIEEQERKNELCIRKQLLKEFQEKFASEYDQIAAGREELAQQRERLEFLQKEILKCRKAQMRTLSLALIFYVFDKTSGLNSVQSNDRYAALLTRLFGKDQGGIKDSLQLIIGKKQELTPRFRTEIQNRFAEAYSFFEELDFQEGIRLLQNLEAKFYYHSN
jgi:hypothetical protein